MAQINRLLRRAARLRVLAARGMDPKLNELQAEALEMQAFALMDIQEAEYASAV